MHFHKITVDEVEALTAIYKSEYEFTCDFSPVNLIVWQDYYGEETAVCDNIIIVKLSIDGKPAFSLPFCDVKRGMELIREYSGEEYPLFWAQEGKRFETFKELYGEHYNFYEQRDGFDYIYLKENLCELKGKKYHSKRNHISAFKKKYNYTFESLSDQNTADILACSENWYSENLDKTDKSLLAEKKGIETLLNNKEKLGITGGALRVDGKIIAFTLASFINGKTVDIHIEKALKEYDGAYAVINNEFAKSLNDSVIYINREDDMGNEGLRFAKTSYHPEKMAKKYVCEAVK